MSQQRFVPPLLSPPPEAPVPWLLLSKQETAKTLRISESMVSQLVSRGELTPLRIGDRVLFAIDGPGGLREWIASRLAAGQTSPTPS